MREGYVETNFNFYIHLINIIGLYEHDVEDDEDEDQGEEWWKRWIKVKNYVVMVRY